MLRTSQTLVKELTVEDGGDFRSMIRMDIETFKNLLCIVMQYSERRQSFMTVCDRPRMTAHQWPMLYGIKTRTRMLPLLQPCCNCVDKKHNM